MIFICMIVYGMHFGVWTIERKYKLTCFFYRLFSGCCKVILTRERPYNAVLLHGFTKTWSLRYGDDRALPNSNWSNIPDGRIHMFVTTRVGFIRGRTFKDSYISCAYTRYQQLCIICYAVVKYVTTLLVEFRNTVHRGLKAYIASVLRQTTAV